MTRPANFTRQTADLREKFRREGKWHLLALHRLLMLSDFGREGIERSGSFRFADHLYRDQASGLGWLGRWLDRRLLNLPASRGMRRRFLKAIEALRRELIGREGDLRVLAVPCGIPRDISELVRSNPQFARRIHYTGMDLDPAVLAAARDHLAEATPRSVEWIEGNALEAGDFPGERFDFIVSTGLGEFLEDDDLARFYRNVFDSLEEGGVFFTSATAHEPRSHYLMTAFELKAHYRGDAQVAEILRTLPWTELKFEVDVGGLQTFVRAVK